MKCKELTSYGVSGKRVEFNLMDCYEASHTMERVECLMKEYEGNNGFFDRGSSSEIRTLLEFFGVFLHKIAVKPSEMPSIFDVEEEEKES